MDPGFHMINAQRAHRAAGCRRRPGRHGRSRLAGGAPGARRPGEDRIEEAGEAPRRGARGRGRRGRRRGARRDGRAARARQTRLPPSAARQDRGACQRRPRRRSPSGARPRRPITAAPGPANAAASAPRAQPAPAPATSQAPPETAERADQAVGPRDPLPRAGRARREAARGRPRRRRRTGSKDVAALAPGLARTRSGWISRLGEVFAGRKELDPSVVDEIEKILLTADIGVRTSQQAAGGDPHVAQPQGAAAIPRRSGPSCASAAPRS